MFYIWFMLQCTLTDADRLNGNTKDLKREAGRHHHVSNNIVQWERYWSLGEYDY